MKNSMLITVLGVLAAASFAHAEPKPTQSLLMKCNFRESMSVSFGYSSVYTVTGQLKELSMNGPEHFYEVDGAAQVAIDKTASTNRPGAHLGDTTAEVNNYPAGGNVMIDVTSSEAAGDKAFRILVFAGASNTPNVYYRAYKITSLNGNGLAGMCFNVDPRLVSKQ